MNPFSSDTMRLIFIFFVPGFISMKVYDLFVPTEKRDFSKSLFEAISYSCINFAVLYWMIVYIHSDGFQTYHSVCYYLFALLILFIAPMLWPIILFQVIKIPFFRCKIVDPVLKPWDKLFGQRKAYWILIHLKDGRKVGGKYGQKSFSSTFPAEEQLYIEEVWTVDQKTGQFVRPVDDSHGFMICKDEFQAIEFFR